MNDIIKITDGKLDQSTIDYIVSVESQMKVIKAQYEQFKSDLRQAMEENGILSLDSENLLISYVSETTREALDTKALKQELPDIYNAYARIIPVKASVRVKVKNGNVDD